MPLMSTPTKAVTRSRHCALGLLLALALLCLAWEWKLAPTGEGSLVVKAIPLLLALPGIWRYRLYTFRWLSLLVWLYVLEGLVRGTTEAWHAGGGLGLIEALLGLALFAACAWHVRARLAAGAAQGSQGQPKLHQDDAHDA